MGLDLQPDGLNAGLAGHCQPDKKYPWSQREKGMICMSASRGTISHPQLQCCQNKKRLFIQCKSYQQNQQIVLRISFSNSTFLSKGTKKGHAFRPGHHASHICHRAYCGFANNRFQLLGYELSNEKRWGDSGCWTAWNGQRVLGCRSGQTGI